MTRKKRLVKKTGKAELLLDSNSSLETQQLPCDVRFVWLCEGLVGKENCDTSTCDGRSSTVKELMANRARLAQACPVFRSMFTSNMRESQSETMIDIVIHNYSYDSFHAFINYLYTGAIKITTDNAVELLAISSEYMANDLTDRCSSTILSLVDYESSLCQMFDLVGKFDSALEKQLLNLIANHTQTVIQSRAFLELTEESVHLILSNKILAINSEVHLLRAVIAWTHYQLYGTELAIKELALENEEEYLTDEVLSKAEDLVGLIHFDVLDTVYHQKLKEFVGTKDRDRACLRTVPFYKLPLESFYHWEIKHSASTWRSYPLPSQ